MKIGVVTFFNNGNYGSELQAFAMNHFLTSRGHDVCFCKFRTKNKVVKAWEYLRDKVEIFFLSSRYPEYKQMRAERENSIKVSKRIEDSLQKSISGFSCKYIKSRYLPRTFYAKDLFDCWICGSDQVWTALKIPFQKERFMTKVPANKKIAYAVSLGPDKTPDYFAVKGRKAICNYKYLSFREKSGCNYVKKTWGVDSYHVLDPTMLVGQQFWQKQISEIPSLEIPGEYCVCYFLGHINESVNRIIEKNRNGKKLLVLAYPKDAELLGGSYIQVNPLEFVKLISNAVCVFTDSFHGTVFSLLMNKEFISFERTHSPALAQTNRITGLLSQLNVSGRYVKITEKGDGISQMEKLDYASINSKIQQYRIESERFLEDSLESVLRDLHNE